MVMSLLGETWDMGEEMGSKIRVSWPGDADDVQSGEQRMQLMKGENKATLRPGRIYC